MTDVFSEMNGGKSCNPLKNEKKEEKKEQISFTKCLLHETKKAYIVYATGFLTLITCLLFLFVLDLIIKMFGQLIVDDIIFIIGSIVSVLTAIELIVFSIDVLVYVALLLLILPLDYAVIVCWLRRLNKEDIDDILFISACLYVFSAAFLIIGGFYYLNFEMLIVGCSMMGFLIMCKDL